MGVGLLLRREREQGRRKRIFSCDFCGIHEPFTLSLYNVVLFVGRLLINPYSILRLLKALTPLVSESIHLYHYVCTVQCPL